jgi:hypothetical protein
MLRGEVHQALCERNVLSRHARRFEGCPVGWRLGLERIMGVVWVHSTGATMRRQDKGQAVS